MMERSGWTRLLMFDLNGHKIITNQIRNLTISPVR